MGTIIKWGKGTLESRFSLNGKDYKNSEKFNFNKYIIELQKTTNFPATGGIFLDHWKFNYFNGENFLKGYISGEPLKNKIFHIHKVQNANLKEMPNILRLIDFAYHKTRETVNSNYENPYNKIQNERGLFYLWNFLKDYLKKEGFEKIVTKADYRFYDTLSFDFKLGWQDKDRERKLEEKTKNIKERNSYLKPLEKISGLVELEYPLNSKNL